MQPTAVADQMVDILSRDPALEAEAKQDPAGAIKKLAEQVEKPAYWGDTWFYRFAVVVLGSLALITAVGALALVFVDKAAPDVLVALGSAAAGSLVGLFATSPGARQEK